MAAPIITIASVAYRGRRVTVNGSFVFPTSLKLAYYMLGESGEVLGPFPITAIQNNTFTFTGNVAPGTWSFRIVATPDDGSEPGSIVTSPRKLSRGVGRSVMPEFRGSEASSAASNGIMFDPTLRRDYSTYLKAGAVGQRRVTAANSISSLFGTNPVLRILRNGREIMYVVFDAALTVNTDVNGDVSLVAPAVKQSTVIQAGDLLSGKWTFILQGGTGLSREITGTVGPVNSGKHIILETTPTEGFGFKGEFKFTFPRSIDGL